MVFKSRKALVVSNLPCTRTVSIPKPPNHTLVLGVPLKGAILSVRGSDKRAFQGHVARTFYLINNPHSVSAAPYASLVSGSAEQVWHHHDLAQRSHPSYGCVSTWVVPRSLPHKPHGNPRNLLQPYFKQAPDRSTACFEQGIQRS